MDIKEKIELINNAVKKYFDINKLVNSIGVNELYEFAFKDVNGLKSERQIRIFLRVLRENRQLSLIPSVSFNDNWRFIRLSVNDKYDSQNRKQFTFNKVTSIDKGKPYDKDEHYVLGLCDKILKTKSHRQYRFDFLRGDSGVKLPVDAYYETYKLVIEYRERQHSESVSFFDKPNKKTVSGVHRGEQRKIYDQRRRDVLPQNGINLIEISYSDFEFDSRKRIIRNYEKDLQAVIKLLNRYL